MSWYRTWAPLAETLEIEVDGERFPLERDEDGFYAAEVPALVTGARYGLRVNGDDPTPDPRSRSQPEGVHGPSEVIDPSSFQWTDEGFVPRPLAGGLVYELHVGTFSREGTFEGAIRHLDHLVDLGVTHVELMPVVEFSGNHGWGYDGVSLYAPHRAYGGPEGLVRLIDACHARGLAVILDVVYNHLGPSGNYLGRYGSYFTRRYTTPWGDALNLDGPDSGEVRRFFLDNAAMWFTDYHVDGLRLDAVHAIMDESAMHLLEELSRETAALSARLGKSLVLIAESDLNDPKVIRPVEAHGWGMDAQWSDDLHHALHALLTGERSGYYADYGGIGPVAKAFSQGFVYAGQHAPSRRRRHGRPLNGLSGKKLLGYLQTHDQVGNRARGDRISQLCSLDRVKVGLGLVLSSPFVPMLFMGDEWGATTPFQYFTDHQEEDLAESVRQGRRREFASFGWKPEDIPDPQAPETFLRSRLDWEESQKPAHAEVLRFVRSMIKLRREVPGLLDGDLGRVRCHFDEEAGWLVVERGQALVVANLGRDQHMPLPRPVGPVLLASGHGVKRDGDGLWMPADTLVILEVG